MKQHLRNTELYDISSKQHLSKLKTVHSCELESLESEPQDVFELLLLLLAISMKAIHLSKVIRNWQLSRRRRRILRESIIRIMHVDVLRGRTGCYWCGRLWSTKCGISS